MKLSFPTVKWLRVSTTMMKLVRRLLDEHKRVSVNVNNDLEQQSLYLFLVTEFGRKSAIKSLEKHA